MTYIHMSYDFKACHSQPFNAHPKIVCLIYDKRPKQADEQTDRQTDEQTERQTDMGEKTTDKVWGQLSNNLYHRE